MIDDDLDYCLACSGSGEGQYDGSICPVCHGRGVPPDPVKLQAETEEQAATLWEDMQHGY